MDLDKALLSAILKEGRPALDQALRMGIAPERLNGEGPAVWSFLLDYHKRFGGIPNPGQVQGKTGVVIDDDRIFLLDDVPDKSAGFFIEEINNRYLHGKIRSGLESILKEQEALRPRNAMEEVGKLWTELQAEHVGSAPVEPLWRLGPDIRKYYDRIKAGERGVLTPWPSVNEATLGFWPEDLVLFVARSGVGKTFSAVLLALFAWQNPQPQTGKLQKVLFITTEVSKLRIGMRFMAAQERFAYGEFTHGRLSFTNEAKLDEAISRYFNDDRLFIIGGDFDFKIESVGAAIDTVKPDLVVIDGVYLLKGSGATRTEQMANTFNDIKRLCKSKTVPIVITTQFNREVKKDIVKTVQMESIALSDAGSWNADLIFGMVQTDDMKALRHMILKPLKVREGEGKEVNLNWDFERMDFSERNPVGGGGGDADEKGTSLGPPPDIQAAEDDDLPF